jgi:Fe-S cluster assembly protein SufD
MPMSTAVLDFEEMQQTLAEESGALTVAGPVNGHSDRSPQWLRETRATAWETFAALPMPVRTDEHWRFANLKTIDLSTFKQALPLDEAAKNGLRARSRGLEHAAGRMVFGNDQLLSREVFSEQLRQKGVIWLPLEEAAAAHPELFRKHFMREEAILGGQKFAALHESQARAGTFLYIPRGVEIELPLETFHWLSGSRGSCFPHTLIVAEEMARATVIDRFASAESNTDGLACGVNDLWLGAGSQVTYVSVQDWSRKTLAFQINSTVVGRDATAKALALNLGGSHIRSENVSHLRFAGGRSEMLAVSLADGSQEFDQRAFQIHEAPHTSSDLLYKNSLDGQSRSIFSGLIRVDPGAHQTDAYQKVRNLLLSDDAEANSAPGLEIEADDVRCTHGATSGQIEAEELFYLQSRGITRTDAQRLIVFGFVQEVIDRLGHDAITSSLSELVHAKFKDSPRLAAERSASSLPGEFKHAKLA